MIQRSIIPTLSASTLKEFKNNYTQIKDEFSHYHIVMADSKFNKLKTPTLKQLSFLQEEQITFELHLMCLDPLHYLEDCITFSNLKRVLIHYEAIHCYKTCYAILEEFQNKGFEVGIVINVETPFEVVVSFAKYVDAIQFMSSNIDETNSTFTIETLQKCKRAHDLNKSIDIQAQGCIGVEEVRRLVNNGATKYCVDFNAQLKQSSNSLHYIKQEFTQSMNKGIEEQENIIYISKPYSKITPYIYLGPNKCCQGALFDEELLSIGIQAEINLEEFKLQTGYGINYYLWLPTVDHQAPSFKQLLSGAEFMNSLVQEKLKMYVHCELGHTRSPTMVVAYFIYIGFSYEEAHKKVSSKRPSIHITSSQEKSLRVFERKLGNLKT